MRFAQSRWDAEALAEIAGQAATADLTIRIARTYWPEEAGAAQQESERGHLRDKIVRRRRVLQPSGRIEATVSRDRASLEAKVEARALKPGA